MLIPFASALLALLASALAAPLWIWAIECAAALLPRRPKPSPPATDDPLLVLIPAHNEAAGIRETIASIAPQLHPRDRLVVIADNCTDDTAAIARSAGAQVLERDDTVLRGKSYALAYALRELGELRPSIVIIIDADCIAAPGSIRLLAATAAATGRPVQGSYFLEAAPDCRAHHRIAVLAFFIKNVIRSGGLDRLGFPCFLNGTGMAFPPGVIGAVDWGNGKIAEDKWMTVDLALSGLAPLLCEQSRFTSELPLAERALATQRKRWIHGHLESIVVQGPRLLTGALRQRRLDLLVLALDLLVLPFSILVAMWPLGALLFLFTAVSGLGWFAFAWFAAAGLAAALALAAVDARHGKGGGAALLAAAPKYVLARIPVFASFLSRRETQWVRTARRAESDERT